MPEDFWTPFENFVNRGDASDSGGGFASAVAGGGFFDSINQAIDAGLPTYDFGEISGLGDFFESGGSWHQGDAVNVDGQVSNLAGELGGGLGSIGSGLVDSVKNFTWYPATNLAPIYNDQNIFTADAITGLEARKVSPSAGGGIWGNIPPLKFPFSQQTYTPTPATGGATLLLLGAIIITVLIVSSGGGGGGKK